MQVILIYQQEVIYSSLCFIMLFKVKKRQYISKNNFLYISCYI